jgi:hypothetical protein
MAKKKAITTPDQEQHDAAPSESAGRLFRVLMMLATLTLLGVVGAGAVVGHRPMLDMARVSRRAPVVVRIQWPEMAPAVMRKARAAGVSGQITWMDPETQRELTKIVKTLVSDDPFDDESLQSAQRALMNTGWFAGPVRLSRNAGGIVEVRAGPGGGGWRIPFGVVRVNDQDRVVTRDGELLGVTYQPDASRLKLVVGATLPPPGAGERWPGGDVQAGLALLEFLRPMPGYPQVYAVDVSEYQSRKTLTIVTQDQTRITWGGSPHEFNPGQATGEAKMRRLADLYARFGRIDAGRALVDVRTEDGASIVLHRESSARAMR